MTLPIPLLPEPAARFAEQLLLVQDSPSLCPYLPKTVARMPLYVNSDPGLMDVLMAAGFRRSGPFVYFTNCSSCNECQATRVPVKQFRFTKSLKRVLSKSQKRVSCHWQSPIVDDERLRIYNAHRDGRKLGRDDQIDEDDYVSFLVHTCFDTRELSIKIDDELVAVSIMDVGKDCISAVYTFFDPKYSSLSLGTLAVLKQIQWAIQTERTWAYLGYYVRENRHLNYKARFQPQQRRIDDQWTDIIN